MTHLRRIIGLFVMIAGIIGLLLSLAGLIGIWVVRPLLTTSLNATVSILNTSVDTSQKTLVITYDAMEATVNTVDALSEMLNTTAVTVVDTQPVITQANSLMGETLPTSLVAASDSLVAARAAAQSLESTIKSFESFQTILSATPFLSALVPESRTTYNPEKSLADSLGELSESIQKMPSTFEEMSVNLDKADDNLDLIKSNLESMSQNVSLISISLNQYQAMISESRTSMDNLMTLLSNLQNNLGMILKVTTVVLILFFLWLLAAQVVIFSQGWELYHGTASHIDAGKPKSDINDSVSED